MSEQPLSEDPAKLHRKFAATSNNRAWELSPLERTSAQDEEMLQASYASAWHWGQVGNELDRIRAATLESSGYLLRAGPASSRP